MKTIIRFLLCFVLYVLIIQSGYGQITYSWTGGTGNWSVSTNWLPNGVPSSADNVLITTDGTYTLTLDIDATVSGIEIGGTSGTQTLSLNGRTLTVEGDVSINTNGHVSISTSTISGNGTLSNSGSLTAFSGIINMDLFNDSDVSLSHLSSIDGSVTTTADSRININCTATNNQITLSNGFTNHGLIYFTNSGTTALGTINITNGTLINAPDGTIESTSIALYPTFGNSILAPLDNQGNITISQGFILNKASATHTNSGTIHIQQGGTLYLTQTGTEPSFTSSGSFTVDSTAAFSISGGEFSHSPGTFSLNGAFSASNNASITFSDPMINKGGMNISSSTVNCASSFTNRSSLNLSSSSSMTFAEGIDNQHTININTSTISGNGTLTNSGTLVAFSGTINMDLYNDSDVSLSHLSSIDGSITTTADSRIHINCTATNNQITLSNGFTNHGLIYYTNSGTTALGTINMGNDTLLNAPDGTIQSTSISLYPTFTNKLYATLINEGQITTSQGYLIQNTGATHINKGNITVSSNKLAIQGGPFNNEATGIIMGNGTLDVSSVTFTNAGTISPGLSPGILNVTGSQYQTANGKIHIEIGGTVVNSEFDQLKHTGNVALDGSLNIELIDNFVPVIGNVFDVMTFASATGQFKRFTGRSTGKGISFEVEQAATFVRLTTVEPYNIPPYLENLIEDVELTEDFDDLIILDFDTIFQDEDAPFGDSLIYSVSLSNNVLEASVTENKLNMHAVPDANGVVSVIVFASDTSDFSISDTFNVTILPENDLPLEFTLLEPLDKQILTTLDNIDFKWNGSFDMEDDPLLYELQIIGTTWDTVIGDLADTSLIYIPASSLQPNTEYEWTVSVSDGHGVVESPDTFSFTTPFISSVNDLLSTSSGFELKQNHPNPFIQNTTIEFIIPQTENVTLQIYTLSGQVVGTMLEEKLQAGSHTYHLDAGNFKSGVYFYRLEAGEFSQVRRMILLE